MFLTRWTHRSIPWGPSCVTRDHTTPHMPLCGVATGLCLAGGLVFLTPRKFCASLSLALGLFPRRFRGGPFCCWRVIRNGSEWFSEVTVNVMQVMLEGPSVPSGRVTAPRPSPALVTLHGWLPLPIPFPCSAPGFLVLQEGCATFSDSSAWSAAPPLSQNSEPVLCAPFCRGASSTPVGRSYPQEVGPQHIPGELGPPSPFRPAL